MYEDSLDCPLHHPPVYGTCYSASTPASDSDSLALITEDVYEKSEARWKRLGRPDEVPDAIRIGFFSPSGDSFFATSFYFNDKDLADEALSTEEARSATVEGQVYVFSGDVGGF